MDNIVLINIFIIFIGLTILLLSFFDFTYGLAAWLVFFPIVVSIRGFEGLEIFPMERVFNGLLFGVALIKMRGNWHKIPGASLFIYFLFFLFAILLSAIFSDMPLASLARTLTFLVPLMMAVMVLAAVIDKENGLRVIMRAMIIGFAIVIGYAMVELILNKNLLLEMGILPWDEDYMSDVRFGLSGRISSFIGQPVYAALYLLVMLPITLFYRKHYINDSPMRFVYDILVALGVIAIFLTGTRSVYLPLIILPLIYLFYRKRIAIFSSTIFYVYLVALILLPFVLPERFLEFTMQSFQAIDPLNIATTSGLQGRLELTKFFWELFKEHIFLGFGPGYIQRMAASLAMFKNLIGMENQYAGLLVESGLIGFLTFMVFIIKAIKMSAGTCRDDNLFISDWAIMTSSIFTIVMIIAISVFIVNGIIMNYLMLYLAIMLWLKARDEAGGNELENPNNE